MNKNYRLINLFLIFFIMLPFYYCTNKHNQTNNLSQSSNLEGYDKIDVRLGKKIYKVSINYPIIKQAINERKFVSINTIRLFNIGGIQDTVFLYPTFVKSDNLGNIYVLDMQDCSVKKFSSNGSFVRKFGRKGNGPGEFRSPFRMDVSDDGKVLVLDPNLNKCELFESDKTKQFLLSISSHSVCFSDSISFITFQMLMPFDYSVLLKHNISDDSSEECQNLILNNNAVNIGPLPFLTGDIYRGFNNCFLYVPKFMNHFVKYSTEGKIIYARNTIDNIKLPSIQRDNPNIVDFRLPNEFISSLYAFVVDNKFYNVSSKAMINKSSGIDYVIDVYSLDKGDYQYSFVLKNKEKMRNIFMDKDKLYLLKDNLVLEVLYYKINE